MNRDSFRPGVVGLTILLLLLAAWSLWFFLARIPLYESSGEFQVQRDGTLLVTFAPEALGRIMPGQAAMLRLAASAGQPAQTFAAEVSNIPFNGQGPVEVYVFSPPENLFQPGLAGDVKIQVESVSPAVLVVRAAGQLGNQP